MHKPQSTSQGFSFFFKFGLSRDPESPPGGESTGRVALLTCWMVVVAIVLLLQPWLLGFYMDDWNTIVEIVSANAPFSSGMFSAIWSIDPTRPVSGLVRFICTSVFLDVPQLWHFALISANVMIVVLLARLQSTLLPVATAGTPILPLAVSSVWLLLPWCAGFRFWPVLLNVHLFFIAILWLTLYVLRRWRSGSAPWLFPFLVYLIVCLGYEAFYFQFVVLILLGVVEVRFRQVPWRRVGTTALALVSAQALAFAWYFISGSATTSQKPIDAAWKALILQNFQRLVPEMEASMGALGSYAVYSFVLAALLGGLTWWHFRTRCAAFAGEFASACAAAAALLAGSLLSVVAFSLGARPILGLGAESRGFSIFSLWGVPAIGLLLLPILHVATGRIRKLLVVSVGITATIVLLSGVARLRDWGKASQAQQRILLSVPVGAMSAADPSAPILAVWPIEINRAPVFSSPWDVNPAIHVTYPALASRRFILYSHWGGTLTWNGKDLRYEYIPGVLASTETLYLWRPGSGEFINLREPIRIRGNLDWEYIRSSSAQ